MLSLSYCSYRSAIHTFGVSGHIHRHNVKYMGLWTVTVLLKTRVWQCGLYLRMAELYVHLLRRTKCGIGQRLRYVRILCGVRNWQQYTYLPTWWQLSASSAVSLMSIFRKSVLEGGDVGGGHQALQTSPHLTSWGYVQHAMHSTSIAVHDFWRQVICFCICHFNCP